MTHHTHGPFQIGDGEQAVSFKLVDLVNCSPHQFCEVLALAAKIGVTDAMTARKPRTAKQLTEMLCLAHRVGHARALKQAYSAGRFHVGMMGKP
jgi:hypothetical protein